MKRQRRTLLSLSSNYEEGASPGLVSEAEAARGFARVVPRPLEVLGTLRPLAFHQHSLVEVVILEVPKEHT